MPTKGVVVGMALLAGAGTAWAQGNEEKKTLTGPSTTALGPWQVVLADGAKANLRKGMPLTLPLTSTVTIPPTSLATAMAWATRARQSLSTSP